MSDNSSTPKDYIPVSIYRDFYFNENLKLPTLIKVYSHLEEVFLESQYLACITVQVNHLQKIEYQYGSDLYGKMLCNITELLKKLKESAFREDDIFIIDLVELDTFVIFLSTPRDKRTRILDHLEAIAERARMHIEQEIFRMFFPYLKEYSRPAIGYGLIIKNPMINNMRLIMQLINDSREMGIGDVFVMKTPGGGGFGRR
jgi:GGDEF domain-containing protein